MWNDLYTAAGQLGLNFILLFLPFVALAFVVKTFQRNTSRFLIPAGVIGAICAAAWISVLVSGFSLKGEPEREPRTVVSGVRTHPAPEPAARPEWGMSVPVGEDAVIRVPRGWDVMRWTLPGLQVAMGDEQRQEYVTVQLFTRMPGQSLDDFERAALAQCRSVLIECDEPGAPHRSTLKNRRVVSRSLSGRGLLPDHAGRPMAARVSCVEGVGANYVIVQWRHAAWDAQTSETFNRLLNSLEEPGV